MRARLIVSSVILLVFACAVSAVTVTSPDGRVAAKVWLEDGPFGHLRFSYSVSHGDRRVIADSALDLLAPAALFERDTHITAHKMASGHGNWQPVCGERGTVADNYNECRFSLQRTGDLPVRAEITFRCYDGGIAFRYTLLEVGQSKDVTIDREMSEFRFDGDHDCWATYSAQGIYSKVPLSKLKPNCERPLVVRIEDDLYAAVGEAGLVNYARMRLAPTKDPTRPGIISHLSSPVQATLPLTTPWRFILIGKSPGDLLEKNDLVHNLNAPCAIRDTRWIKPGKVIREVTLTTAGGRACVDFAASNGLQYVEFDAGWYGHEYDEKSDARTVTIDPRRSKGPLDLREVIRYGESKGIGVIVYVNRRALERQLDDILPLYRSWGIKGMKYGFVNVGSQQWTRWLHEAIRKAADHQLMVDVHDEYRPTGFSRTYPNLMTMEGIRGDECKTPTSQTLTILFTRQLAGAGDNTICYYNSRVDEMWSHGFQLAKSVCFFSPWQFLYWYDRPLKASELAAGKKPSAGIVGNEPELEFFANVPTTWDGTRVVEGAIGEYATIARRKGTGWFVGCMNGDSGRTFNVPLQFLDPGKTYEAKIYTDDPTVPTRTHVKIETRDVKADTILTFPVKPHHGVAMRIAER